MHPLLELTPEERQWNDYYDSGTKRGVLERQLANEGFVSSAAPNLTLYHYTARRSRVFKITWTGDVCALKVNIFQSTGEKATMAPCHIPLLEGYSPHSTRSKSALFQGGVAGTNLYPTVLNGTAVGLQAPSQWEWILYPNIVLGGNEQLTFEYSLEDPTDPFTGVKADGYFISHTVHSWEFPGYQGGAV